MKLLALLFFIVLPGLSTRPAPNNARSTDSEEIQAEWLLISSEIQGIKISTDFPRSSPDAVFSKGKVKFPIIGKEFDYFLDPKTSPKSMDLCVEANGEIVIQPAIYSMAGDTLQLSIGESGQERPTQFTSPAGCRNLVVKYRRLKK